jgi:hypothetical protein
MTALKLDFLGNFAQMVVGPWGEKLGELDETPGILYAEGE